MELLRASTNCSDSSLSQTWVDMLAVAGCRETNCDFLHMKQAPNALLQTEIYKNVAPARIIPVSKYICPGRAMLFTESLIMMYNLNKIHRVRAECG